MKQWKHLSIQLGVVAILLFVDSTKFYNLKRNLHWKLWLSLSFKILATQIDYYVCDTHLILTLA